MNIIDMFDNVIDEIISEYSPISEPPELGAVEPAQIKDFLPSNRSVTGPTEKDRIRTEQGQRYNFLLSERDRLLKIIRSSPITNQETGACYVACLELDEIHKELEHGYHNP